MRIKQVIAVRKDLKMRRGKECAQAAHASMAAIISTEGNKHIIKQHDHIIEWLNGAFTKIVVYVNSEEELKELYKKALDSDLDCSLILDSGRTEFSGVPTYTTCAIGPGPANEIDFITGDLKLL